MSSDDETDRTTSHRLTWPKEAIHNGNNHEQFKTTAESFTRHFGNPGKSINDGRNRFPLQPQKADELDPDDLESDYKYDHLLLATYENGSTRLIVNNSNNNFAINNRFGATTNGTDAGGALCTITVSNSLSQEGTKDFKYDIRAYEKTLEKYLRVSSKLITFLLSGIHIEIQSALELVPAFKAALADSLSFEVFHQIGLKYGHTTNGRMIAHRTCTGLQLKQTGTHEEFCHNIFKLEKTLNADLGGTSTSVPAHPHTGYKGYISIRHLCTIIYQMGLSQNDFAQRLEVFYSTNPTGVIAGTLEETMSSNSLYLNTKTASVNPTLEPTSSLFSPRDNNPNLPAWNKGPPNHPRSNSTKTTSTTTTPTPPTKGQPPVFLNGGANTKCRTCGLPFPTVPRADVPGQYHTRCKSCFQKEFNSRTPKATNTTPSTPAIKEVRFPPAADPKSAAAANKLMLTFLRQQEEDYEGSYNLHTAITVNQDIVHTSTPLPPQTIDYNLAEFFTLTPSILATPVPALNPIAVVRNLIDSTSAFRVLRICSTLHRQHTAITTAFEHYISCLQHSSPLRRTATCAVIQLLSSRPHTRPPEFRFRATIGHIQGPTNNKTSPHREQRFLHRSQKLSRNNFVNRRVRFPRKHLRPTSLTTAHHINDDSLTGERKVHRNYSHVLHTRLHNGFYANCDNPAPFQLYQQKYLRRLRRINRTPKPSRAPSQSTPYFYSFQTNDPPDDVSQPNPFGYWDSGCTFSVTPILEVASNPMPITPFTLGTSKKDYKGISLTHVGAVDGVLTPANRIYYCKDATCTLFSVGWFLEHNYTFTFPRINGRIHQLVRDPSGTLVSDTVLGKNFLFKLPSHFLHPNTSISNGVCHFTGGFAAVITFDSTDEVQFTKPQQLNIKLIKTIHLKYGHLPEAPLSVAIENHCFTNLPLTRQDVLNFFLTKKCTCISTRMHMPSNPNPQPNATPPLNWHLE